MSSVFAISRQAFGSFGDASDNLFDLGGDPSDPITMDAGAQAASNEFTLASADPSASIQTQGQLDAADQDAAQALASAVSNFIDTMNTAKAQVQSFNDQIYAAVAGMSSISLTNAKGNAQNLLNIWHTNAVNWMNEATTIVADIQSDLLAGDITDASSEVQNWIDSGSSLVTNAQLILRQVAGSSTGLINVISGVPSALSQSWQLVVNAAAGAAVAVIQAAGQAVSAAGGLLSGATMAILKPLMIAGAGIALLLYLFDQSSGGRAVVSAGAKAAKTAALAGYKPRSARDHGDDFEVRYWPGGEIDEPAGYYYYLNSDSESAFGPFASRKEAHSAAVAKCRADARNK
jgi:hypothetical protein